MALKTMPLLLAPLVLAGAMASGADTSAERAQCVATLTPVYLAWVAVWVLMFWGLAAASFGRKDL